MPAVGRPYAPGAPGCLKDENAQLSPVDQGNGLRVGLQQRRAGGRGNRGTARQPVAVDFGATTISATADDVAVSVFFHH